MSNLKTSIFWIAFYLTGIVIIAQFDYDNKPIIDFAKYFYFLVVAIIPATIFFPSISTTKVFVPMAVWGGIYLVMLQVLDRTVSSDGLFGTVVLEFVLVEVAAWLGYQLAYGISNAESVMDAMALSAFPNRAHDIDSENERIKIEITRSRRYHRPLSLIVIESESEDEKATREMLKSIQHDLLDRFVSARIGQIIDDRIRQNDLVLRDYKGRFIILCPETDLGNAILLGRRISHAIKERMNHHVLFGGAAFPDDALTFDDLLLKARNRLSRYVEIPNEQIAI